ncbi:MAG: hypothetical protein ACRDVC_05295 [Acidimicrobiales bacterium]
MKPLGIKSIAAVALVAAMGVSAPAVAFADSTITAPPTFTARASATANVSVWATFHKEWKAYVDGLRAIRLTYRAAVANSRAVFWAAQAQATTPAAHQAAQAALNASLAADLNARVAAITAAGDPPAPPADYNGTAYVQGIQAANVAFRASIVVAQDVLSQSLSTATTSWERHSDRLTYEFAVGTAIVTRATALEALGAPPANPGQPS